MDMDFAVSCPFVQRSRLNPVLVHQLARLLQASFRPRLATTPLRFANPSPPSGWIEDFHLQAVDHARHTTKGPPGGPPRAPDGQNANGRGWLRTALGPSRHFDRVLPLRTDIDCIGRHVSKVPISASRTPPGHSP